MKVDKNGIKYYDVDEAMRTLGVGRTTFIKRVKGIQRWKPRNGRKFYYKTEDIDALKQQDEELLPVEGDEGEQEGEAHGSTQDRG